MGSNHSKGFVPLTEFVPLIEYVVAVKSVAFALMKKVVKWSAVDLTPAERDTIKALESRKNDVLQDLCVLAKMMEYKMRSMKRQIRDSELKGLLLDDSFVPSSVKLQEHGKICRELAADYQQFGEELEVKYRHKVIARKVAGFALMIGGTLLAAALIYCSAGLAIPFLLSASLLAANATMAGAATTLTDAEVVMANKYLMKIGAELTTLSLNCKTLTVLTDCSNNAVQEEFLDNVDYVLDLSTLVHAKIEKALLAQFK